MAYQGGKQKLGKEIHDVILFLENELEWTNKDGTRYPYFEPFVGFCGVFKHFCRDNDRSLHACDISKDIIDMWRALQNGWKPSGKCAYATWNRLKTAEPSPSRTLYGHVCSFGGQFFTHFLNDPKYAQRGSLNVKNTALDLANVLFHDASSYDAFEPKNMTIYCDPPYRNNKVINQHFKHFDHDRFWETMRRWSKHNLVLVSEYTAPDDFACIWEKQRKNFATDKQGVLSTERIFVHRSNLKFG